jgi:hypothetical protein
MFLCSRCKKRNLKCVVFNKENSSCCSECVFYKAKCNVKGILVSKWQSLKLKTDCLEQEEEAAIVAVTITYYAAAKNMACVKCLRKQKNFLKFKGKDIVCCSLKTLDKLKEAEEKERQVESEHAAAKAAARLSNAYVLALSATKSNPFAGLKALSLFPKV